MIAELPCRANGENNWFDNEVKVFVLFNSALKSEFFALIWLLTAFEKWTFARAYTAMLLGTTLCIHPTAFP